MTTSKLQTIYVGTYTEQAAPALGRSQGIYVYDFDPSNGELHFKHTISGVDNPSFLALTRDQRRLFAVNETAEFAGVPGGGVSILRVDPATANATLINAQPTHGVSPCYVRLSPDEQWVFVANYSSGNVTVLPVLADGSLGEASSIFQSHGHGADPERQESAHAHSVTFDPSERFVLVADLGLDQILIFTFDDHAGQLIPHDPPSAAASAPGAGPRHLQFHPNGRILYAINELDSTVAVYAWDQGNGTLELQQTLSALPADFTSASAAADIHITSSGRFLYTSNRWHDSIAVFAVDPVTSLLSLVEIVPSGGRTPRNFGFDLTENYLLVANQESDNLVTMRVDQVTGRLMPTGFSLDVPRPVFVIAVESRT